MLTVVLSASAAGGATPLLLAWPVTGEGTRAGAVAGGGAGHGALRCGAGFSSFFSSVPQSPAAARALVLTGKQTQKPESLALVLSVFWDENGVPFGQN